ncbi:MAG: tail fiber domain-containing protein [Lewinella sp.]|nr:tail fiber domain-containing protein [Lewinella sp.]
MKTTVLSILTGISFFLLTVHTLTAQAPEAMNYQAVARDASGNPISEQVIQVRLSILRGAAAGSEVYEEQHTVNTTATGLFTLAIGEGTVNSGSFSNIDWGSNVYHLQVEINTGSGYVDMGTMPFLSVPYALYAKESGDGFSLPFDGNISQEGATAFRVANTNTGNGLAITGIQGGGSSVGGMTRAAIFGTAATGHGIVGFTSGDGAYAGVWGRTNDNDGYGIHGSAAGGIAGFFQSLGSNPGPALVTDGGPVGIGTKKPLGLLHVEGDLFVNSAKGAIDFGYPNNGNQWHLSTLNGGEDLQFFSKADGSTANNRRMILKQNGQLGIGNITAPNGQVEIESNSAVLNAQLTLTESANDYARLTFRNTVATAKFWTIAAYTANNAANEKLNFYHNITGDIMTIQGQGNIGLNETSPTARLHIGQGGQTVGRGLRFDDGINEDWDITHGFGLRLHFGGDLRGFFNANTGAYTQSSDGRLKSGVEKLATALPKLQQLQPLRYYYQNAKEKEPTIGFIAQEVAPIFPELVSYSEADDLYGINYAGFSVVAIKAIQEQQALIEAQQQQIATLEKRLEALENAKN